MGNFFSDEQNLSNQNCNDPNLHKNEKITLLSSLSRDVLRELFLFLPPKDLLHCKSTCTVLFDLIEKEEEFYFKSFFINLFKDMTVDDANEIEKRNGISFKYVVSKRYHCGVPLHEFSRFFKQLSIVFTIVDKQLASGILNEEIKSSGASGRGKGLFTKENTKFEAKVFSGRSVCLKRLRKHEESEVAYNGRKLVLAGKTQEGSSRLKREYVSNMGYFTVVEVVSILEEFNLIDQNLAFSEGGVDFNQLCLNGISRLGTSEECSCEYELMWT